MGAHEIGQGTDRVIVSPSERREAILQFMGSAERELALSLFRCDDLTIIDEVAAAVKRGVHVRVLITQRARGWKEKLKDLTLLLRSIGADIRPYENPLMKYHAKYIVVDDRRALVTSLNFTRKCFDETCDFMVFTDDPAVVTGLLQIVENDCSAPSGNLPELTHRLIVGPEHSRRRLTELLDAARSDIRIVDHRVTDLQILELLKEKQRQGVLVQVVGHGLDGGLICHGRMILIDSKAAVIGSIHLSQPSLDLRREVAIVIEEPGLVTELYDYFHHLVPNEQNLMQQAWLAPDAASQDDDEEEDE
jgi:phosphatidylserine/phosphatidylglycerophosphate/cardiolipin synthase-like enzyme